ncbi:MAG: hypothetical protein M0Z47_10910 [Actinomycetota bacterium]|nr:hypothetical protein [Actinomycetota bacterium]
MRARNAEPLYEWAVLGRGIADLVEAINIPLPPVSRSFRAFLEALVKSHEGETAALRERAAALRKEAEDLACRE